MLWHSTIRFSNTTSIYRMLWRTTTSRMVESPSTITMIINSYSAHPRVIWSNSYTSIVNHTRIYNDLQCSAPIVQVEVTGAQAPPAKICISCLCKNLLSSMTLNFFISFHFFERIHSVCSIGFACDSTGINCRFVTIMQIGRKIVFLQLPFLRLS